MDSHNTVAFSVNGIVVQEMTTTSNTTDHPGSQLKLGSKNFEHPVYAVPKQMLLPSLIIKLGLMKNFTKSKDKTGEGFQYHIGKCPRRSEKYLRKGRLLVLQFVNLLKMKIFFASFMATKGLHLLHCSQW